MTDDHKAEAREALRVAIHRAEHTGFTAGQGSIAYGTLSPLIDAARELLSRPPLPAPSDVEQAIKRLESRGFGERMDYFIGKQDGDALRLIFDAARRSPVPADTPSEGDFPCCDDGEHVPAEIAGDLFTATLNRAQWHRVDEALAAHGRNDAVWSQIAATKTAVRPTPPELEREGDAASRVATPPEDVERVADLIRNGIRGERDDTSICVPVGDLKVLLAALAAVPADEEAEKPDSRGDELERAIGRVRGNPNYATNADKAIADAIKAGRGLELVNARPIPESEEDK